MLSVMRDRLLRVSEAAALLWEDIEEEADGTGRLLIRRSTMDPDTTAPAAAAPATPGSSAPGGFAPKSPRPPILGLDKREVRHDHTP